MGDSDMYGSLQHGKQRWLVMEAHCIPNLTHRKNYMIIGWKELDEAINYLTTNNISDILGNQISYTMAMSKMGEIRQLFKIKASSTSC